jgi:hypothetical protein
MVREGALAEISFHWSQLTPRPSKPAIIHTLNVATGRTLRLVRADISAFGVSDSDYQKVNHPRTQQIGDAVQFLEFDGLIAPSARWNCDNLMLFPDNLDEGALLTPISSEAIDWLAWANEHGIVSD